MIAAIYARKSTPQRGVRDEDKSVARQVDNARAFAHHNGWTVADEYIYIDDGINHSAARCPRPISSSNDWRRPEWKVEYVHGKSLTPRQPVVCFHHRYGQCANACVSAPPR
jgi:hypothetical protein